MGRILVVANETLQAEAVDEVVRAQLAAGHRVHFVVPLRIPVYADLGGLSMYGFVSLESGDAAAIEPRHRQQSLGRQVEDGIGDADRIVVGEDAGIEPHVPRFEGVVQLLA